MRVRNESSSVGEGILIKERLRRTGVSKEGERSIARTLKSQHLPADGWIN